MMMIATDDVDGQDDGDAIADTPVRDPFTDPHDCGGTCGQGRNAGDHIHCIVLLKQSLSAKADGHGGSLYQCKCDSDESCDGSELSSALFPLFFLHLLQLRDGNRQKLNNNRGGDVGCDVQREDGHVQEGTAGEGVNQAEGISCLLGKPVGKVGSVYAGDRELGAEPDHYEHCKSEENPVADFLDLKCVFYGFKHD